jgi:osmoprotectant transport system ATP-binding protein
LIRLEKVSVRFPGGVTALHELDLEIPKGQFAVLVGASGSGKTTALRLINRLQEASEGRVLVNGTDVRERNPIELRRSIGYAIQGVGLIGHMTVGENVALVPRLKGASKEEQREVARAGLERVRMTPDTFLDRHPHELSGGQRQRVGIARAMAADPDLVLLDEPFGALDNVVREEIQDEFKEILGGLHKTIVLVTHDMHEAIHMGDRIVVMNEGRVIAEGSPEEVVLRPANDFVKKLLGRRIDELQRFARGANEP